MSKPHYPDYANSQFVASHHHEIASVLGNLFARDLQSTSRDVGADSPVLDLARKQPSGMPRRAFLCTVAGRLSTLADMARDRAGPEIPDICQLPDQVIAYGSRLLGARILS